MAVGHPFYFFKLSGADNYEFKKHYLKKTPTHKKRTNVYNRVPTNVSNSGSPNVR
jgi:hypothetical protein